MKKTVVLLVCLFSLVLSSVSVVAQTQNELEDELLGTVSAQYESNGDPGLISGGEGDLGGASYGAYQFASAYNIPHTFAQWCVSSGNDTSVGNTLLAAYEKDGNKLSANFNAAWKKIASENKDGFLKLQRLYVKAKYYDPAVNALKNHFNLDVSLYGIAFKNAVWSRTLQHGLGSYENENGFLGIMKQVSQKNFGGLTSLSEENLITAIYEESGGLKTSGTNAMTVANAGGNSWIIRTYDLEGKYMKYFSGNSAAVQAGVYLRLRVKEIKALLEMLATYGGYSGEENGRRTPYLNNKNQLVLTECDTLTGFYAGTNVALSVSDVDKIEGKGALNFIPLSSGQDVSYLLKCKSLVDYSSFSRLLFYLLLPNIEFGDDVVFSVKGITNGESVLLNSQKLSIIGKGWQLLQLEIPDGFSADGLLFTITNLPQNAVGARFSLDSVVVDSKTDSFPIYNVSADALYCRTIPNAKGTPMGLFSQNAKVTVVAKKSGWYLCSGVGNDGKVLFGWSSGGYLQPMSGDSLLGDVNADHQVSSLDALQILRYVVGKRIFSDSEKILADVDADGEINAKDALKVLRIVVHKG